MKLRRLPGFTMIELLVVIAVIGILAVALLASLNPLEQIRKGRDTRTRSDSSQLASALERYNASIGYFPWQGEEGENLDATGADVPMLQVNGGAAVVLPGTGTYSGTALEDRLDILASTNEVKAGFIDKMVNTSYADTYLYYNDEIAGASVHVCFVPESNSFGKEAWDRCKANDGTDWGADFPSAVVYGATGPCPDNAQSEAYSGQTDYSSADADEMICLP